MQLCKYEDCKEGPGGTRKLIGTSGGTKKYCCSRCRIADWMSHKILIERKEYERLKEIEREWQEKQA